jgi:hypothetical protein
MYIIGIGRCGLDAYTPGYISAEIPVNITMKLQMLL